MSNFSFLQEKVIGNCMLQPSEGLRVSQEKQGGWALPVSPLLNTCDFQYHKHFNKEIK